MIFLLCIREIISKLLFMQEPTNVCEEPNNPTVAAKDIPAGLKGQSRDFMAMEDLMVTITYVWALEDSISGAKQKGYIFKSTIESVGGS